MKEYKIYTYTIIYVATEEFIAKIPYIMAVAEDNDGKKFLTRVEGYEDGMKFEIGNIIKFKEEDSNGNIVCCI